VPLFQGANNSITKSIIMRLTLLDPDHFDFPPTSEALDEPNGLLAVGGDLSAERLINAYRRGIFPWYSGDDPILWWSPNPRAVLFPNELHVSKSLQKRLRKNDFSVTFDQAFSDVMENCRNVDDRATATWISDDIKAAYCRLHDMGYAHSVEVWQEHYGERILVGGLYGLAMGKVFFGESMFSRMTDASKIALVSLTKRLIELEYQLIDCQVTNPHLLTLGAREIPRTEFEWLLSRYL
jgi:leucyl/phenylalanyl-tRNA--protein transferase